MTVLWEVCCQWLMYAWFSVFWTHLPPLYIPQRYTKRDLQFGALLCVFKSGLWKKSGEKVFTVQEVRNELQRGGESCGPQVAAGLSLLAPACSCRMLFVSSSSLSLLPRLQGCSGTGCPCLDTQIAPKWPHSPWGEGKLWPFVKALIFPQGTGSNWSFMIKYFLKSVFSLHLLEFMWKEKKMFSIKGYLCNNPVLNANSWITGSWQCCFLIFHGHFRT